MKGKIQVPPSCAAWNPGSTSNRRACATREAVHKVACSMGFPPGEPLAMTWIAGCDRFFPIYFTPNTSNSDWKKRSQLGYLGRFSIEQRRVCSAKSGRVGAAGVGQCVVQGWSEWSGASATFTQTWARKEAIPAEIWVWLRIKELGQTAGLSLWFHLPRRHFRYIFLSLKSKFEKYIWNFGGPPKL